MAKEIFMPKLSSTMQVGTVLQWFKEEGDPVEVGEPLFEIMTDKINIEVESYEDGVLLKRYFEEDDEVPINHVVGYIGEEGEEVPDLPPGESGVSSKPVSTETPNPQPEAELSDQPSEEPEKVRATPAARRVAREREVHLTEVEGSGPKGRIHQADVERFAPTATASATSGVTPLAEKVAVAEGMDLQEVEGSGPRGKVYRADVEKARQPAAQPVPPAKRVKMAGIRKAVADRMLHSKTTAPHVTLNCDIDMAEVVAMRKQLLGPIEKQTGYRLSYTEIILKATAHALKRHPNINISLEGNEIIQHDAINIGMAVALEDGLLVPVIKDADRKGLVELTVACKTAGQAAKDNKLKPDEMSGGTFTVSNLGMYAVDTFNPVINQPESAILGIGRIHEKPVGLNGQIVLRPMMGVGLSFDHRVIDGAPAAAFLTDLKAALENPFELLM
ncbi:branched-chain alpha-keto acid dehydrogenase subunit E2 [Planococcus antarcticus DSM 14505]|uniref:Dihydrolipoamide acetyltransferase component of pyruvate dehydrogenase complex n=1 Tax=Planococcus antarcticus DSM 14505 TaxID=1185653 RepID=A0A1C7DDR5_9BACL|nr:dihydrolipoamide acetyltransferase family protein [Planococcus antarcticus]ANU09585.1 branched-chain alpha-keto acid dehydrogenase subunit E2 [Planococcus antarcticus DSM 14505]EIM08209.1 branched-chain alpha-keto acid dehydrogenase subunit E2 [Planococcus antarcticus DSM 14505]